MAKNIYSSSIEEQHKVVKENFPCVECGKTYGTKASLRTHKYNQGQEHSWSCRWRVASCISSTPSWRQSHVFSWGGPRDRGWTFPKIKDKLPEKLYKKCIFRTRYLIIGIFLCIPVLT
jgi:hypothetical protein